MLRRRRRKTEKRNRECWEYLHFTIFGERLKRIEGVIHRSVWGRAVQVEGATNAKAQDWSTAVVSWSSKGASEAGVGDGREECEERNLGQQEPDYAGFYMSQ